VVIAYTATDSEPGFEFTILNRDGTPLNLTTATGVEVRCRLTTGSTLINRAATVVNPTLGQCLATWATGDLATVGIYNLQARVTWTTGRWSSHPNNTYDALVIQREVQA